MAAPKPTFADYWKNFWNGYRTPEMSAGIITLITAIHYVLVTLLGALANGVANELTAGTFVFSVHNFWSILAPAVVACLGYIWTLTRNVKNPFVSKQAAERIAEENAPPAMPQLRDVPPEM